jgi:hypothetical protein
MLQAEFYYWDQSKEFCKVDWQQIEEWITGCDLFIVIITGHTVKRGLAVGKEVGIAKSLKKKILPIVSDKVPLEDIRFLEGITYQPIDLSCPDEAIQSVTDYIKDLYEKKKLEREAIIAQKQHVQVQRTIQIELDEFKIALAVAVIIVGIILLARKD